MTRIDLNTPTVSAYDAFEIERLARIERSRFVAAAFAALLRGLVARLRPVGATRSA